MKLINVEMASQKRMHLVTGMESCTSNVRTFNSRSEPIKNAKVSFLGTERPCDISLAEAVINCTLESLLDLAAETTYRQAAKNCKLPLVRTISQ